MSVCDQFGGVLDGQFGGTGGLLRGFCIDGFSGFPPDLQWLPITIIAGVIVIIIHGMLLGLSKAFNVQELERYSKSELLNGAATLIMAIFLVTILSGMQDFSLRYFICGPNLNQCQNFRCAGVDYQINEQNRLPRAIELLQCRMGEKALAFAELQEQVTSAAATPLSLLTLYFSLIGLPIFQGNYITAWFNEAETYRLLNHFLTVLLIGTNSLIVVAEYIKQNMLSFFLPFGLVLRAFHFTRGMGAFLMSMAIGFYFIFPVIYIITDPGFIRPSFNPTNQAPVAASAAPLCYPTFSGLTYSLISSSGQGSSAPSRLSLDQLRADVSSVYSSVLLQPFVAFAITIIFVRYLMYLLGGESQDLIRAVAKVV